MLRKKLTNIFTSQQGLVNKAAVLHQSLRSYAVLPQDIPLSILQLGSLYRKILENDRETLQKRVQHASDGNPNEAKTLLEAINKLLNYHVTDNIEIPPGYQLQESLHLKECLAFMRERSAYAAEIKQYLVDMKADIATTPWKTYVSMNIAQTTNYLLRSSDDDSVESDDDSYVVYDMEHLENTGEYACRWEDAMPAWVHKLNFELNDLHADRAIADGELLNMYHKVVLIINNVHDDHIHEEAYSFLKQHRGEIASISYLPLQPEARNQISQ